MVIDLSQCTYLDSTFMGCLIGLRKTALTPPTSRFALHADRQQQVRLFSTTMLAKLFDFIEVCPQSAGETHAVEPQRLDARSMGQHVMSCHQRLAALGGEQASAYQAVADRLAQELNMQPIADDPSAQCDDKSTAGRQVR